MRKKILVKGRIYRPSYEGFVNFYVKEDETEREAIARTLRQTSFKDGISANEIVILDD